MAESHVVAASNNCSLRFIPHNNNGMDAVILRGVCVELMAPIASGYEYKYIN